MAAPPQTQPDWLDVIAFDTEVARDASTEDVVFVHVGGGNGSQCAALRKRFPNLRGRIILQDRAEVLETAVQSEGTEKMAHDLLTEQPVKDARAYYFCRVLQDCDDDTCIQILQMHLPALQYNPLSRLYIDEKVFPDETAAGAASAEMSTLGARERKQNKWRWLLDQSGMEIVEIRKFTELGDSVIIAKRRYQDQWR